MLESDENLATISEFADYLEEALSEVTTFYPLFFYKPPILSIIPHISFLNHAIHQRKT